MNPTHHIIVHTAPEYPVYLGSGLLGTHLTEFLLRSPYSEFMVVTDSTVAPLYLERVLQSVANCGRKCGYAVFPAGESSKQLSTVATILSSFAGFGLTRTGAVLALGGGVTGDMAGFAAAIWLRGVPFIQLPTTLLAMVDSSVGGKTGVDLPAGKNLVGAFRQPAAVFADCDTLATLPAEQQRNGLAEMLKTAVIGDAGLFEELWHAPEVRLAASSIARCIQIKAQVVAADPEEHGQRKLLNLGHTAGHAVEQKSNFTLPHGYGVAIGMVMAAQAGVNAGLTSPECRNAIAAALNDCGLPTHSPWPLNELLPAMQSDKKRAGNQITVVVPHTIGECLLHRIALDELPRFWEGCA